VRNPPFLHHGEEDDINPAGPWLMWLWAGWQHRARKSERTLAEAYPQYLFHTTTGAELSLDNALSYLFMACQAMPECGSFGLRPILHVQESSSSLSSWPLNTLLFTCSLRMPPLFGLPDSTSPALPRKDVARAAAAYQACVALHQKGFVDDDLNPTTQADQLTAAHYPHYDAGLDTHTDGPEPRVELTIDASLHLGLDPLLPSESQGRRGAAGAGHSTVYVYAWRNHPGLGLVTRSPLPDGVIGAEEYLEPAPGGPWVMRAAQLEALVAFQALLVQCVRDGRAPGPGEPVRLLYPRWGGGAAAEGERVVRPCRRRRRQRVRIRGTCSCRWGTMGRVWTGGPLPRRVRVSSRGAVGCGHSLRTRWSKRANGW
jgi:hypothetical protein